MKDIYSPIEIDEEWDQRAPMAEGDSATATIAPTTDQTIGQAEVGNSNISSEFMQPVETNDSLGQAQSLEMPAEKVVPQQADRYVEDELTHGDILGQNDSEVNPILNDSEEAAQSIDSSDTFVQTEQDTTGASLGEPIDSSTTEASNNDEPSTEIKIGLNNDQQDSSSDSVEAGDIFTPSTVIETESDAEATVEPSPEEAQSEASADLPHSPLDSSESDSSKGSDANDKIEMKGSTTTNPQLASIRKARERRIESERKSLQLLLDEVKQKRDKAQSDVEKAQSEVEKFDAEIAAIEEDLADLPQ